MYLSSLASQPLLGGSFLHNVDRCNEAWIFCVDLSLAPERPYNIFSPILMFQDTFLSWKRFLFSVGTFIDDANFATFFHQWLPILCGGLVSNWPKNACTLRQPVTMELLFLLSSASITYTREHGVALGDNLMVVRNSHKPNGIPFGQSL